MRLPQNQEAPPPKRLARPSRLVEQKRVLIDSIRRVCVRRLRARAVLKTFTAPPCNASPVYASCTQVLSCVVVIVVVIVAGRCDDDVAISLNTIFN